MEKIEALFGNMDFVGQKRAERAYEVLILAFGITGWIVGYFMEDFRYTVALFAVGLVLGLALAVPGWKFYNQDPLKWLSTPSSLSHPRRKSKKRKSGANIDPTWKPDE